MSATPNHRFLVPLLMAGMLVQQIDRNIVNVVLEPIKQEFGLSDAEMGLFAGTLFAVSYMIAGLPLGALADRMNRRNLLAGLMACWSLLTALSGFTQNFLGLALMRIGVGAAEAGNQPTSLSMMSDSYPPERRSSIVGLIYACAGLGVFISFLGGGYVAAHWGWRMAFVIASVPGFLIAGLLLLLAKEPRRSKPRSDAVQRNVGNTIGSILFNPILVCIYFGAAIYTMVMTAVSTWAVSILLRVHGLDLATAGGVAAVAGLTAAVGTPLVAHLSDRVARRNGGNGMAVPAVAALVYMVSAYWFAMASTREMAMVALALAGSLGQAHVGPSLGLVSRVAPPQSLGMAFALFSVVGSTLGMAVGPFLIGIISDFFSGPHSLNNAMHVVLPLMIIPATLFILAGRRFRASTDGQGQLPQSLDGTDPSRGPEISGAA